MPISLMGLAQLSVMYITCIHGSMWPYATMKVWVSIAGSAAKLVAAVTSHLSSPGGSGLGLGSIEQLGILGLLTAGEPEAVLAP